MSDNRRRKDPCDPAHVSRVESELRAAAFRSAIDVRKHPRTGGLAVRVQLGQRHGWLSVERGAGELVHTARDENGLEIAAPDDLADWRHHRLTCAAQVLACHLRGIPFQSRGH